MICQNKNLHPPGAISVPWKIWMQCLFRHLGDRFATMLLLATDLPPPKFSLMQNPELLSRKCFILHIPWWICVAQYCSFSSCSGLTVLCKLVNLSPPSQDFMWSFQYYVLDILYDVFHQVHMTNGPICNGAHWEDTFVLFEFSSISI